MNWDVTNALKKHSEIRMMSLALPRFDRLLITTALMGAAICLAHPAQAAFDPNADTTVGGPAAAISSQRLPDTGVLGDDMPVRPLYSAGRAVAAPSTAAPAYASPLAPIQMPRPLYPSRAAVAPASVQPVAVPVQVRPITPVQTPATVAAAASSTSGVIAPLPNLASPTPAPAAVAPQPVVAVVPAPIVAASPSIPNLPPVDAATAARAEAIMNAEQKPVTASAPIAAAQPVVMAEPVAVAVAPEPNAGFIAPAPLMAQTPVATPAAVKPVVVAQPIVVPEPVGSMPPAALPAPKPIAVAAVQPVDDISPIVQPDLSSQSREALSRIPSRIDSPKVEQTQRVKLDRVSPQIQEVLGKEAQEENYEAVGLSIKVRRPGLDTNYELNQAYNSLMGGDTERAISIYKEILSVEPRNEEALFGLAATYHRLGNEAMARPFYTALLKIDPNHREALNNFLVLVSSESPQDALPELERLELRNPDFSPIPAQIAIVYDKLGYPEQARDKMVRAIELAPDNLTYKYNLAIMLDRQKQYADAVALYRLLIQAALNGEQVPASVDSIQKRLNYITTAATGGTLGS